MGIAKGAARILLKESRRRPFSGRVLVLGKQDVYFDYETLEKAACDFGVELCKSRPVSLSLKPELAALNYISDESFFLSLGFSEYAALDYSDYESADYVFDLNRSDLPSRLTESFDFIADCGTIEHVFHLPNAFGNIFRMLKSSGRVVHLAPSSNYMDHGFYMFSPTLFWDFYAANKFDINAFQVIRHTINAHTDPWEASDYQPGCLEAVSFGGLDDGMYGILCIATKTDESTGDAIPQQHYFVKRWTPQEIVTPPAPEAEVIAERVAGNVLDYVPASSYYQQIKNGIRQIPALYKMLRIPFRFGRFLKTSTQRQQPPPPPEEIKRGLRLEIVDRY